MISSIDQENRMYVQTPFQGQVIWIIQQGKKTKKNQKDNRSLSCDGIRLIVGLGNPGAEYAQTRHNVGTWLVNQLADEFSSELSPNKKFFGNDSKISIAGNSLS